MRVMIGLALRLGTRLRQVFSQFTSIGTMATIEHYSYYPRKRSSLLPTIVVCCSDGKFSLFNGVHTKAVVPVSPGYQQLVVRRENKEVGRDCQVLGKWATNILPF